MFLIIGVPKEKKDQEWRVALTPAGVRTIKERGHEVLIEKNAGLGSGFTDEAYAAEGANIVESNEEVWQRSEMILKVKEPIGGERELMQKGQLLFTYLHLAADPDLVEALVRKKVNSIGYETVQLDSGALPLLSPMSEIAGRMAVQEGAVYLEKFRDGKGILLGGVSGVPPAKVTVLGAGTVGTNSAKVAMGMGAQVTVIDINLERLRQLDDIFWGKLKTLASNAYNIEYAVAESDLVIGSVLVPGAKTPYLVTEEMVKKMSRGSVVVDVAIDQGGCFETSKPTTHSQPTFSVHGVTHYCVGNMPGAVPRTSTFALTNATLPYVLILAEKGFNRAIEYNRPLARGVNTAHGDVVHPGLKGL
jgi:alanine dehydrogenase